MDFDEYQKGVMRTWSPDNDLAYIGLGLTGEAGEVSDLIKKALYHGIILNEDKLIEELGDVLYHIAAAADYLGINMEEIAWRNNRKLNARYPDGFVSGGGNRDCERCSKCGQVDSMPGGKPCACWELPSPKFFIINRVEEDESNRNEEV